MRVLLFGAPSDLNLAERRERLVANGHRASYREPRFFDPKQLEPADLVVVADGVAEADAIRAAYGDAAAPAPEPNPPSDAPRRARARKEP